MLNKSKQGLELNLDPLNRTLTQLDPALYTTPVGRKQTSSGERVPLARDDSTNNNNNNNNNNDNNTHTHTHTHIHTLHRQTDRQTDRKVLIPLEHAHF